MEFKRKPHRLFKGDGLKRAAMKGHLAPKPAEAGKADLAGMLQETKMKLALKLASLLLLALMLVPNAAYADSHGNGGNTCQNCDDGDNGDDEDDDRKKPKFQTRFFGD